MKKMLSRRPGYTPVDELKIRINVGCLMDIPNGRYVRGAKGENILLGGLAPMTGIVGKGNSFKSTLGHYMILSAASKVAESGYEPYINTFDTETNIELERLHDFSQQFAAFREHDIIGERMWDITDSTKHSGDEWFDLLKNYLRTEKIKNKKDYIVKTPILNKKGEPIEMVFPTFGEVDTLTEFETSDVIAMKDKNVIGDSGANTLHMRSGLAKTRLISELNNLANGTSHYTTLIAQVGAETGIQQGPVPVNTKRLQHMPTGDKVKGVSDKFFFLTQNVWMSVSTSVLMNQTTKGPEYPRFRDAIDEGSKDLNIVQLLQLRSKFGESGFRLPIIVSQLEGVLPSLTEFHYIKEEDRWGLEGNNTVYNLILYPDVKISRTTVRSLLNSDPMMRRAVRISAELLQIKKFARTLPFEVPDMKELYEKIGKEYDWNILLNTREYWTFNQYEHPVPFLSSMDVLEMYHGLYRPYWYDDAVKGKK